MRLSRAITLLAAGATAAWLLERRGSAAVVPLPGPAVPSPQSPVPRPQSPVPRPQSPGLTPEPPPPKLPTFEPPDPDVEAPDPRIVAAEQPTLEQAAVEEVERVDVHAVVDDLLAPGDGESIVDAEVVDDAPPAGSGGT